VVQAAVQYFTPDHPAVARSVRGKLMKLRGELAEQLAAGYAQDWADYNKRAGVIRGIDDALKICEEMENEERR
jgi:hypothetical protein